ncbi:PH domain-containing protein [Nocardioides sp. C4-1]|uniref:PH domain-containing protein n=1 Tax=Nocardioides sp. C4-1 TaxID=3151851 RepID=UPI003266D425
MSEPAPPPPGPAPEEWQRLDVRMLLVHPIRELVRFLPAVLLLLVAGSTGSGPPWQLVGVAVPIVLGVLRYLTTSYRIGDGRVELRRGLLSRRITSTQLDRVRTVDLTSSVVHRVLGLTTLRIGTGLAAGAGGDDHGLDLDGLPVERAHALRADLLHTARPVTDEPGVPVAPVEALVEFDPRWLRFAPFTGTGLIVLAAIAGGASQVLDAVGFWRRLDDDDLLVPSLLGLGLLLVGLVVALLLVSVLGFLVTNGGFRLFREGGSWHVRRGLLTTRETSIDEHRLAGVVLGEPLALRLAHGRHLQAIVTGIKRSETGSATLVPPSDADVAPHAARVLLGHAGPVDAALRRHGPAATRRRWVRALALPVVLLLGLLLVVASGGPWWLLVLGAPAVAAGVVLAADRTASLGHTLVDGYLVARSGSLVRQRQALDVDHVIGWTLRATWFQRRVGLTSLAATTAGGSGGVVRVLDVPEPDAVRLAGEALPGLVAQFTRPNARPDDETPADGVRGSR